MTDEHQNKVDSARMASMAEDAGEPAPPADPGLLRDIPIANRILFEHGVVDAFGHVSARHDKDPNRFLLSCNMAPSLVTEQDVVEFHLDGRPVTARGRKVYLERFIHGQIYRARPDVQAVVHSHAPGLVPFSVAPEAVLKPIWHMSGFLGAGVPVFEIREAAGEASDMLIRSNALGEALSQKLGDKAMVLMRGHGATVVAPELHLAVFRAVYAQINADLQFRASQLGKVTFLNVDEAEAAAASNESQVERAWNLWKDEVAG